MYVFFTVKGFFKIFKLAQRFIQDCLDVMKICTLDRRTQKVEPLTTVVLGYLEAENIIFPVCFLFPEIEEIATSPSNLCVLAETALDDRLQVTLSLG